MAWWNKFATFRRTTYICISFTFCIWDAQAQYPYVLRFVPGSYLADNRHKIVLYNPGNVAQNIGGYYLVTRDYAVRLPAHASIPPGKTYTIGKKNEPNYKLDFALAGSEDFVIRLYSKKIEGNYFVLFDPKLKPIDALYHAQLPNVPFLPDSGRFLLKDKSQPSFKVPPVGHSIWGYFPVGEDPAIGFEQVNNEWRVISADFSQNVYPALAFRDLTTRFSDNEIKIEWYTTYEENVRKITIERSIDQETFTPIEEVEAHGSPQHFSRYLFYDTRITLGQKYYYRLQHIDPVGNIVYSKVAEVLAAQSAREFWLDVFPIHTRDTKQISIRFFSAFSQRVKLRLMDTNFREIALLFDDLVFADTQNLLKITESLPKGKYWVMAIVENKRFLQEIEVIY